MLRTRRVSRGLTLMELLIVLTILVAVAGIMVSVFPSFLTKSHTATCAANIPEIAKSIQMFETQYMRYPNGMDNLAVGGSIFGSLAADHHLTTHALTAETAAALSAAGINSMATLTDSGSGDWHPTFFPYGNSKETPPSTASVAEGTDVAMIDMAGGGAANAAGLGLDVDPDIVYAVFGLGTACELFGKLAMEPPVHFSDSMDDNPNDYYMRFAAVFQLTDGDGDPLPKAKFVGVGALHSGGLEGVGDHTEAWWADHAAAQE